MAVTAKFIADFSSFHAAVTTATANLATFQSGAANVDKALKRMGDSFSGKKIIQEATLMTQAYRDLAEKGIGLTESEQRRMNATMTEAIAKYRALGAEAQKSIGTDTVKEWQKLEAATRAAEKPTSSFTETFKATVAGFITAQAVIYAARAAFRSLTEFVTSSVAAYAAQESAVKKMTTALQTQGQATPQVIQSFKDLASTFQRTTVYSDELLVEMQALLVQIGDVAPRDMQKALTAATDLASGLGIDLETATKLVGKAFAGETGTLKRYGIVIDEAKLKAEGMPAVLDAIQSRFGGQAAAEIDTYTGKVKQLANAWDDLKEAIGEVIVTDPLLNSVLKAAKDGIVGTNQQAEVGKRSLLEWWMTLTGGTQSRYYNLWLLQAQEIIRASSRVSEQFSQMRAKLLPPTLTQPALTGPAPGSAAVISSALGEPAKIKAVEDALKQFREEERKFNEQSAAIMASRERYNRLMETTAALLLKVSRSSVDATVAQYDLNTALHAGAVEWLRQEQLMTPIALKTLPGVVVQMNTAIPLTKEITVNLGELANALANLAQVAGGSLSKVVQGLSTVVAAVDAAQKGVKSFKDGMANFEKGGAKGWLAGITEIASGILGIASAAIAAGRAIYSVFDRDKGRDLVENFAKSFGGFDALHDQLLTLGDAGEALWIKLTQGVGRNNPEQAARVIAEVEDALRKKQEAEAAAIVTTEAGAQATIESATQAALALDELNGKIQNNADAWGEWSKAVTGYMENLAQSIRALPMPTPGGAVFGGAQAHGGDYLVKRPTLFLAGEAGTERATFTPAGAGSGDSGYLPITLMMPSGEVLLREVVRVVKHRGLN